MKTFLFLCMLFVTSACVQEIESYEKEYNKSDYCEFCNQPLQKEHIH